LPAADFRCLSRLASAPSSHADARHFAAVATLPPLLPLSLDAPSPPSFRRRQQRYASAIFAICLLRRWRSFAAVDRFSDAFAALRRAPLG